MAKIKFERTSAPTGSVEFSRNPSGDGGYEDRTKFIQVKAQSDGGVNYVYNKGLAPQKFKTLTWPNLPDADVGNFMTFVGVVVGGKYNFTLTDVDGTTKTARIWNAEEIVTRRVATGRQSLSLELLIES